MFYLKLNTFSRVWAELEFCRKINLQVVRSIESNFQLIEPCRFSPINFASDSNFTNKHTLSKSKLKLYVLIMVCQHNTN